MKSIKKVRRPSLNKKNLLVQVPPQLAPSRRVTNLYGTWVLSWTYLDNSQAVQVGHKCAQGARHFADVSIADHIYPVIQGPHLFPDV